MEGSVPEEGKQAALRPEKKVGQTLCSLTPREMKMRKQVEVAAS